MENKSHSIKYKKTAHKLLWIVVIETAIILGMVCGFAICLINEAQATDNKTPTYDYAPVEGDTKALAVSMTVAEITAHNGVDIDIEIPEEEVVEEAEGFVRFPATNEVYKVVNGKSVTYKELHMLGLTIWGEANGQSKMEQAAVAWSILNRVDEEGYARGKSLAYVISFPGQYHGYHNTKGARCDDYYLELAKDVVDRWAREHNGEENVGRVLPKEYTYFAGKKVNGEWHNYFRTAYKTNEPRWDWSLPNPYEEETNDVNCNI